MTTEIRLKSAEFRRIREAGWRELDTLVGRVERHGVAALSADDLERLPLLYRGALSSLSVARAIALDRNLLLYLETLSLRAFLAVYGPRTGLWQGCRAFFARGFPDAVRAGRWHALIALLAVIVGGIAGFLLTMSDVSWFAALVPSGLAGGRDATSTREDLLKDEIFAPWPGVAPSFLVLANFLFTNNTTVGIMAFSLGIAAGVPTIVLLAYQGVMFGAFIALHSRQGLTVDFIGWVAMHGVTEFGAIILCGAGGLVIAQNMLFPGRYGRLENLARNGGVAARIAVGAMLMFFIAAILEGGFRQLIASTALRLTIGLITLVLWALYFTRRPAGGGA